MNNCLWLIVYDSWVMKHQYLHWDKPILLENEQAHWNFSMVLSLMDIQNIVLCIYFERSFEMHILVIFWLLLTDHLKWPDLTFWTHTMLQITNIISHINFLTRPVSPRNMKVSPEVIQWKFSGINGNKISLTWGTNSIRIFS